MNLKRLSKPEISPSLEAGRCEQIARKLGGYTLGIMGYATGLGAITNTLVTAGLSLPIMGAISGTFFAGSRALLRPAYQDTDTYTPVQEESLADKSKRIGAFVGGFALWTIGANLFTGGLFNAFDGYSMNTPTRIVSTAAGWVTSGFGARVIRGSFDPRLHEERTEPSKPGMIQSFRDGYSRSRNSTTTSHSATRII